MGLVITGEEASVRWGYARAAVIRDWTIARDGEGAARVWRLTGRCSEVDAYAMTQPSLRIVVRHAGGSWAWPVVSVQVEGASSIVAVLGPKEGSS